MTHIQGFRWRVRSLTLLSFSWIYDNRLDHIHEIVRLQKVVVKCQDLRNDVKFIKEPALVWKREYAVCVMPSRDPVSDMLDNEEMNILKVSATSPWICTRQTVDLGFGFLCLCPRKTIRYHNVAIFKNLLDQ
jgi:hypothetical protein